MRHVTLLVGTAKGVFLVRANEHRTRWTVDGPHFKGWGAYHVVADVREKTRIWALLRNAWWGWDLQCSDDRGKTWSAPGTRPAFEGGKRKPVINALWHLRPGLESQPGRLYLGGDPGALFRSDDDGATWQEMRGLTRHQTRKAWMPGAGGLCLHSIVPHPLDPEILHVAISAAGMFTTRDGGRSWTPRNAGVRADFLPNPVPEVGQCVHKLVANPHNPKMLYQQNHCGIYRSENEGRRWRNIGRGLPVWFGFPLIVHPRERDTIFVIPIESAEFRATPGRLVVYRKRDNGPWQACTGGLPRRHAYVSVMREASAGDALNPAGIYFGTHDGTIYASTNSGGRWQPILTHLPPILSIETLVV